MATHITESRDEKATTEDLKAALKDAGLFREQCYINGEWLDADSKVSIPVTNPATGAVLGHVPRMGAAETRRAIEAADAAWPAWRAQTARERGAILRRWFELLMAHQEDLAKLMTAEQGKPLAESKGEVAYGASFVPWNFPIAMITRNVAPALAAGCVVVVKPAGLTPFCALALAELAQRAGVPKGVMNVVTGDTKAIGAELTSNPLVRKLTFTGSTAVGSLLMKQCSGTIKKMSLELGGNAPFIVFNDADLDAAVEGAIASKYRNTGQTCVCSNRFLVQDEVYEAFSAKLVEKVLELKVGNGMDAGVTQGPLIEESAVQKVEEHIADAVAKGARVLTGGKRHSMGGTFFEPTVLAGVTPQMAVAREETFGPVAPLFRFRTEQDALRMANDTEFGLAAYFYSRDIGRVWRVAEALEYGMVGINTGLISNEVAPFGGVKQSGIGREGSKYGIEEFLVVKYLCMAGM